MLPYFSATAKSFFKYPSAFLRREVSPQGILGKLQTVSSPEYLDKAPAGELLRMEGIGKSFSGVKVLDGVRFDLRPGEVHILAGENGAGKSTLIKILAGVYPDYEGRVSLDGRPMRFKSPQEAHAHGISVIYQEISLVESLSAAENIFLGRERVRGGFWLDFSQQRQQARSLLAELGLELDAAAPVEQFPVSVRQMIEIAKALSFESRVIVMDEPTSTLTGPEVEKLFEIIGVLKKRGCGIIYISHKMEEIYRIADRITVLRDGKYIGTATPRELGREELIRWMVGREIREQFPRRQGRPGAPLLEVNGFTLRAADSASRPVVDNCTFALRAGEIVGLAGLQGSGNSELLHGLFGAYGSRAAGEVRLRGKPFRSHSPRLSVRAGLALLTNDRKATGCLPEMSVTRNITLAALEKYSPLGWLRPSLEDSAGRERARTLHIRAASLEQEIGTLSGGNQQKVILARWLETSPRVLFLDEPTRGVDVGVKHEIYELMNDWTASGCAILLITSEMPELLAMADRILVLCRGRLTADFSREEATQEKILEAAMGGAGGRDD